MPLPPPKPLAPKPPPAPRQPVPMVEPAGPGAEPASLEGPTEQPATRTGTVVVDAKQPAEVYLAGQFVSVTPMKQELPPGTYTFALVAQDGRRRTFEVTVQPGKEAKHVWDFDRMEWR
jgi:hypothetical protein